PDVGVFFGLGLRPDRLQHPDRRGAVDPLDVFAEAAVLVVAGAPQLFALGALGDPGADRELAPAHLAFALRLRLQVVGPAGQLLVAAVGVDQDHRLAVGEVEDRRRARLAALAAGGGQQ